MADEIRGQRMSEYTDIDQASELSSTEKAYYKANARVTTFGKVDNGVSTPNSNYNIPLSEIAGEALPPIESGDAYKVLTVNPNEDGAHWDTVDVDVLPEIESGDANKILRVNSNATGVEWDVEESYYPENPITGDGYHIGLNYDEDHFSVVQTNGLTLKNPVPAPGTTHRGEFLTVNNSDEIVWGTVSGLPDTTGHSQGDVLAIGVSGPDWTAPVHIPVIGTINISPAPSYNYIILQNFLNGHTIGTPISEEDYSDFNNTYPADKSAIGWTWESNWSDTNLVSTTAGSQLLYTEAGFDFSKYGLTTGQIPFGFINADWEWHMGAGYRDITLPTEFTYEVWFNNPNNDWEGTFTAFYKENWDALKIVMDDERTYIMFGDTIFSVDRYEPQGGGYIYEPDQATYEKAFPLSAGQWHHFALSCDGTNLYVFIDGKLLGNIVIANINGLAEFLTTAMKEIDVVVDDFDRGQSCVYLAQLALCDSCKWTSDFELPKEAY